MPQTVNILWVDDFEGVRDPRNHGHGWLVRELISNLKQSDITAQITVKHTAGAGLRYMQTTTPAPDLVLMEALLPSNYEDYKEYRRSLKGSKILLQEAFRRNIPVILVTGLVDESLPQDMLHKVVGNIKKPFITEDLASQILAVLKD